MPLRSTWQVPASLSENFRPLRDKIADTCRRPSNDRFDIASRTIISVSSVEASHCQDVVEDMVGQLQIPKLRITPLIERHVDIGDLPPERGRILRRDTCHILRPGPRQLIDFADV